MVEEVRRAMIAQDLLEAESVTDALDLLQFQRIDLCVVGPGVSQAIASGFLREANAVSRHHDCLFVAIVPPEAASSSLLFAAGADAILPSVSQKATVDRLLRTIANRTGRTGGIARKPPQASPGTARGRVLIVDHHAGRQHQLRTIMGSLGWRLNSIDVCARIEDAPRQLIARQYSSLLICLSPWERDALELIRQQLSLDHPPHITAYSPEATREQVVSAALAGASNFLAYPFSVGTVEGVLAAV